MLMKRIYHVCYDYNGKKNYDAWLGFDVESFKKSIEKTCEKVGINHFQFIFRKRVYSYTCGQWFLD